MFEINQKVVCIDPLHSAPIKKGGVYTVKDMKIHCDKSLILDIGIRDSQGKNMLQSSSVGDVYKCKSCGKIHIVDEVWWFDAKRFRPLDDMYNEEIEELTEVLSDPVTFN